MMGSRSVRHGITVPCARGTTVRRTVDMVIGTYCIAGGLRLLHDDRDFDHMERHLGLTVVPP